MSYNLDSLIHFSFSRTHQYDSWQNNLMGFFKMFAYNCQVKFYSPKHEWQGLINDNLWQVELEKIQEYRMPQFYLYIKVFCPL